MLKGILLAFVAILFIGCGDDDATSVKINNTTKAGAYIVFDSTGGNIPYPNSILFAGSTDGTLNIPYEESDADAGVKSALNTLDGFSTTSPISVGFNGEINPLSLYGNLHVYELGATGIASELIFHVPKVISGEYVATISGNKIVILPIKPLKSNTQYAVVLTTGIVNDANESIAPDIASEMLLSETALMDATGNHTALSDEDATKFEGIRQVSQKIIGLAIAQKSIPREEIVSAWSFKTQTIGANFAAIKAKDISGVLAGMTDTNLTTAFIGAPGYADVWVGALANLPYYLGTPSQANPIAPLNSNFVDAQGSAIFTGMPAVQDTKVIPVLMTVPNISDKPANGWPVVIFQHGITQNRTNLLTVADSLAAAGYAAIAIDLPLHGITDTTSPLYQANQERTFDMDYVGQDASGSIISEGPDGVIDSSGRHYINLASLLTSRDNIRQSASDLLALRNALATLTNTIDVDESRVAFVGHSLGAIAAFGFLNNSVLESVTLAMPGGGIAELLNNSSAFGSEIEAGLATKGVMKGTSAYSSFMLATQTILDDADPINYAMSVGATQNIYAIEVVGNGTEGTSDQVIPNSVATAPLAGTEPLLAYMQTTNLTTTTTVKPNQVARFTVGNHSSILSPDVATAEMQSEMASFIGSAGTAVVVTDEALLYNPAP
jgi:dienelactone hydrolase